MARQLAAIKLRSIWNTLKAQTWVLVVSLLSYAYGLFMLVALAIGLIVAMASGVDIAPDLMVAGGAVATLAWVIVPALFSSQEGTLDPPKLAPYVSSSRRLAVALVLVTGVGAAGVYFALFAIVQVIGWAVKGGLLSAIIATVGALLGIAISWIWTRAVGAWAGRRKDSSRAGKDRATLLAGGLLLLVFAPMGVWMNLVMNELGSAIWLELLNVIKWTPFGAPWALAQAATAGLWMNFAIQLAITVVTLGLGWWFWIRQLSPAMTGVPTKMNAKALEAVAAGRHLVDPEIEVEKNRRNGRSPKSQRYLPGVDRWIKLGASHPTAAIAERTRVYWLRDPRLSFQAMSVLIIVVIAVLFSKFLFRSETYSDLPAAFSDGMGIGMLLLSSFTYGMVIGILLQYDSTALWLEVAAGTKGRHDRAGRLLGSMIPALIVTIISAVAFGLVSGYAALEIFYLFCCMLLLLTATTTVSAIIGAQWIYPVQPPGSSPMSSKGTGQFMTTMLIGMAQFTLSLVIAALPLGLMAWGFFTNAGWMPLAAGFAILWAVGQTIGGVLISGKIFDRTQVELLTKISAWPGHGATA